MFNEAIVASQTVTMKNYELLTHNKQDPNLSLKKKLKELKLGYI